MLGAGVSHRSKISSMVDGGSLAPGRTCAVLYYLGCVGHIKRCNGSMA